MKFFSNLNAVFICFSPILLAFDMSRAAICCSSSFSSITMVVKVLKGSLPYTCHLGTLSI